MSKTIINSMKKDYKKISINNLLALAHILDTYKIFNKRVKKYASSKNSRDDILRLYEISKGKFVLSMKARKFYNENKNVIDIISQYSSISDFMNFINKSDVSSQGEMDYFYMYLNKNKDKINDIIKLLERIQELGFDEIKFNEEEDFKNKHYEIYT